MPTTALLLGLSLALLPAPARAGRATACPDGRFVVTSGAALLGALPETGLDAVVLAQRTVSLDGGCEARAAKVRARKKGTHLAVRWPACGARRKVRLKARIAGPECTEMTGVVKAKKAGRVRFTATRTRCGDDVVDTAGGESCDGPAGCDDDRVCSDGCQCVGGVPGDPTPESLEAARRAIADGATDVPLSPDGTLRFRRTPISGGMRDEVVRNGHVVARWDHEGDATTIVVDEDRDGTAEIAADATRAPSRSVRIRLDPNDDGVVDMTEVLTQVGVDGLTVEQQTAGRPPVAFDTTLVQAAGTAYPANDGDGCTGEQLTTARAALDDAVFAGLACLRSKGLGDLADLLAGKLGRDGVELRCGGTSDCAQIDIVDTLTRGALPVAVGITVGAPFFDGAAACSNRRLIMFHELLHMAIGSAHSPSLDRSTFTGLATDRVYSCADLCFRPALATKDECARCLGVDECDPRCAGYRDNPERASTCDALVDITASSCPSTACTCCDQNLPFCQGVRWTETMSGTAAGPVGGILQVNFPTNLGGRLQCAGWSPHTCMANLACCRRDRDDQPREIAWSATLPFPFPGSGATCLCPRPSPTGVGLVAQLVAERGVEDVVEITCPE